MEDFTLETTPGADIEAAARRSARCICGDHKGKGTLVCWDCFKHRTDTTPLKAFQGTYAEWIAQLPASSTAH